jgi:hypothetical protein
MARIACLDKYDVYLNTISMGVTPTRFESFWTNLRPIGKAEKAPRLLFGGYANF